MEARVDAWSAQPENLAQEATPIRVRIMNRSGNPLRIRYNDFHLVGPDGKSFAAIPPYNLQGEVTKPINNLATPATGFTVAPYLTGYYPGITSFAGPFAYDAAYYGTYAPRFRQINLPTEQMLQLALPEGVVDPTGEVSGFLYFESVGDLDVSRVQLRAELVNAQTGQKFGDITIPFVVKT